MITHLPQHPGAAFARGGRFVNPRQLLGIALFVLAVAASLCASAQTRSTEYRLGVGDNIRVTVYQSPDLTLETRIGGDGTINYPLIGRLSIGGLTLGAAEQAIAKALKDGGYIKQPVVNILPLQIRSSQVSVLGQVNHPGRFPLETFDTRASEMIAIAGGVAATGADVAILTGVRGGKRVRKEIDIPALFLGGKLEDDFVVSGGDVIFVPRAPMFYIYGEVQRPGSYRVERGMTIRQALVQGGGPTVRGTERGLRVYRRSADGQVATLNLDPNAPVQSEDVLYVGESLF